MTEVYDKKIGTTLRMFPCAHLRILRTTLRVGAVRKIIYFLIFFNNLFITSHQLIVSWQLI